MLRVFGIRHHGPGSARSVVAALEAFRPDCVLIEGPPEADALVDTASDPGLVPPVALMVYDPEASGHFVFYPFAHFSPEWCAMRYALSHMVRVRFFDAPAGAHPDFEHRGTVDAVGPNEAGESAAPAEPVEVAAETVEHEPREDPLATLAHAAGFQDPERFWDAMVEQRQDSAELFEALIELFAAAREAAPHATRPYDLVREAAMRQQIRVEQKAGRERIAVVCGAWHAPVLDPAQHTIKADQELVRGLAKRKLAATWVPWSYSRLDAASGYGAGVRSPAWYAHVHDVRDHAPERFAVSAARCFRDAGIDIGPAHAIEAARLAHALAAMRNLGAPGLHELGDAITTVFGAGDTRALQLVHDELVVGTKLGEVPDSVPTAPLVADVTRESKRVRMPLAASEKAVELDLRDDNARERSALLHRLRILGVPWGEPAAGGARARGTFKERWTLRWDPGYVVALVENVRYGNTVALAARAKLISAAAQSSALPAIGQLLTAALVSGLADALPSLLQRFDALAAATSDVPTLMAAVPGLLDLGRYGDVRGTDTQAAARVATHLVERVAIGLPLACTNIDDDGAATLVASIDACDQALKRGQHDPTDWVRALAQVAEAAGCHPLLAGRATRLLLDRSTIAAAEAARRLGLALSPSVAAREAPWIEGFLGGSALLLLHEPTLLGLIDEWLAGLPGDRFLEILPLLRRAFAEFTAPERRHIGERLKAGDAAPKRGAATSLDLARASLVLPTLKRLLGIDGGLGHVTIEAERLRRWRLVLGGGAADGIACDMCASDARIDNTLAALYDSERSGGLGGSNPNVARWLGDIREFFPNRVVQVMQHDAIERLDLKRLMFEPEVLESMTPDVNLVATLLSLKNLIPSKTKATARLVVKRVVEDLEKKLANPLRQAISGALNRSTRKSNPRHQEIDWPRTIRANLKHYQPDYRTVVPDRRIGFGRKSTALKDIILCVDQSGSMAGSVVYSSIMGAVMASMRSVSTRMVVFDTSVVDLSQHLNDPVDLLFGTQLGGGTDIAQAIRYCRTLVTRPRDTIMVLISDLIEGSSNEAMLARSRELVQSGVKLVVLLALDDRGTPSFDAQNAAAFGALGAPAFGCTPDAFPDLMAAAIQGRDLRQWAGERQIAVKG